MTEPQNWEPVEDGVYTSSHLNYYGEKIHEQISLHGEGVLVANGPSEHNHDHLAVFTLPDDLRVCRRVPVEPSMSEMLEQIESRLEWFALYGERQMTHPWAVEWEEEGGYRTSGSHATPEAAVRAAWEDVCGNQAKRK